MRMFGSLIISALLAVTLGTADAGAIGAGRAGVRLVDPAPLALGGVGFAPHERIRLTVELGEGTVVRTLRAGLRGRFSATFLSLRYGRCGGSLRVTAVGSKGSRVRWELVPLECPDRGDA